MIFLASNSTRFTGDVRVRVRVRACVCVHVSTLAPNCTCTCELGWGDYRDMCCMFVLVQMHAYARARTHARTQLTGVAKDDGLVDLQFREQRVQAMHLIGYVCVCVCARVRACVRVYECVVGGP